jgi:hypothetical protein
MRRPKTILRVERLEDRCTPATWGNPWPDAAHLSLSFVPDGTQVGKQTSNLFQTMNAVAPTSVWENAILQAFQTWAAPANMTVRSHFRGVTGSWPSYLCLNTVFARTPAAKISDVERLPPDAARG